MSTLRLAARLTVALLCALPAVGVAIARAQESAPALPRIHVLHLDGAVTPVVASYLVEGIADAESDDAAMVVIQMDTPGGNIEVTRGLTRRMRAATIPVVVWVGPQGARAASAGTFVTLAAHIAAMAPGTSIGAASPVGGQGEDIGDTERSKITNVLVTEMREFAARRGAQAQSWVESAIRNAETAGAEEAQQLGVVDLLAPTLEDLLRQLDGRPITVAGRAMALTTTAAEIVDAPMGTLDRFLHTIASPNVAYILLSLGMMGLIYEFSNPGFGLGGVVGAICLLLAVYALGVLPATYSGVGLILVAFALFFADVKLGTHGLIAMGGVVALVLGGVLLFDAPDAAVSPTVLATVAVCCGAFFLFAARMAVKAQGAKVTTGNEGLVGATGVARSDLSPEGLVAVWGETWRATSLAGPLPKGAPIEVAAVDGLRVQVRPATRAEEVG